MIRRSPTEDSILGPTPRYGGAFLFPEMWSPVLFHAGLWSLLRSAVSIFCSSGSSGKPRAFLIMLVVRMTLVVTLETLPPINARPSQSLALDRDQSIFSKAASFFFQSCGWQTRKALPTLAVGDHFRDATKMVFRIITRCVARLDGPLNGGHEVFPAGVTKGLLKVPSEPEFQCLFFRMVLGKLVELDLQGDDSFGIHSGGSAGEI
jgi:hypothetical protein